MTKKLNKTRFKTAYSPSKRIYANNLGVDGQKMPSRTVQASKDECDINTIMKRYKQVGIIDHVNTAKAHYGDYTAVNEYQDSMNLINQANADFMALPSDIRQLFNNDAGEFLEFATNPKNLDEMIELGLAKPKIVETKDVQTDVSGQTKQAKETDETSE